MSFSIHNRQKKVVFKFRGKIKQHSCFKEKHHDTEEFRKRKPNNESQIIECSAKSEQSINKINTERNE